MLEPFVKMPTIYPHLLEAEEMSSLYAMRRSVALRNCREIRRQFALGHITARQHMDRLVWWQEIMAEHRRQYYLKPQFARRKREFVPSED